MATSLPYPFFLAPMAELTTPALRRVVKEFCPRVALCSEMLSAAAIVGGAAHNSVFLARYSFDDPYVCQIVGNSPEVMADAAAMLSSTGCLSVDINMGCSAPDLLKKGQGARLLADFDLARRIVRACRASCSPLLSVKMRSGFESSDEAALLDFALMLQDEGVDYITLHPRHAKLSFRRKADWRLVALLAERLSIPVIGNGDIASAGTALLRLRESGCAGIMIGREAVRSPWIFRCCDDLLSGRQAGFTVDIEELFLRVLGYLEEYLPEHLHKSRAHRFSFYFSKNAHFSHVLFTRIRHVETIEEMKAIVRDYYERNPEERSLPVRAGNPELS